MKQHSFLLSHSVKTRKFEMKHASVLENSTRKLLGFGQNAREIIP